MGGTDPMTGVFIGEREEDLDAETLRVEIV